MSWLAIGIGGIIGTCLRYGVTKKFAGDSGFPWPVFLINMVGSFLLGVCYIMFEGAQFLVLNNLLGIGFLGAFTTFSTFSFELIGLLRKGAVNTALLYFCTSAVFGPIFAILGIQLTRAWEAL